jgi:hypothetical protein
MNPSEDEPMRIFTPNIVVVAACLALFSAPLAGCKKKHKPDHSTPLGIVKSYIWAIDHHDCEVLGKVVTGKFKRHLEKRGKEGCHHIMKAYAKQRGKTKFADIRVVKTGEPTIFYEEEGRVIVALPLTRQDRDDVAYFDLERTDRGWQVVGENAKPPRWYTGPAPQLNRPDIRPDAPPTPGPTGPVVAPPPPAPPSPPVEPSEVNTPPPSPPADSPPPTSAPPAPPITEKGPPLGMGEDDPQGSDGHEENQPPSDEPEGDDH